MRRILLLLFDALAVSGGLFLAAEVRFDGNIPADELRLVLAASVPIILGKIGSLYLFQCDRWSFRYAGSAEFRRLVAAIALGSLVGWTGVYLIGPQSVSRAILILEPLFSLFFMGAVRFGLRVAPESIVGVSKANTEGRPVLLVGAGEGGVMALNEIRRHPGSDMEVVGFIDDDPVKLGQWINGVRVVGSREDIPAAVKELGIEEILIAIPSAEGEEMRKLIASCRDVKARFRIVPGLLSIIQGEVDYDRIREIQPEDLLGRETAESDPEKLRQMFGGKKVLVTGAGGSIGSELVRQLAKAGANLVLVDQSESAIYLISQELADQKSTGEIPPEAKYCSYIADIRNRTRISNIINEEKPEYLYHAAACKHVPLMEDNIVEAVTTNIFGTRNLIDAAEEAGVSRFLFISTDKAVRPTSMMGATKRLAEILVLTRTRKMVVAAVRFGNVFGSSGSVVLLFKKQIEKRRPITVTDPEVVRYFMTVQEGVFLVIQASLLSEERDLFVLEMGQPIRIQDLAKDMITLAGLRPEIDIPIVFTGLRPGEKLVEEVITKDERAEQTEIEKVFRIRGEEQRPEGFDGTLEEFGRLIEHTDETAIRDLVKKNVPEFKETP